MLTSSKFLLSKRTIHQTTKLAMGSNQSSLKLYTFSDISSLISNPLPSNVTLIDVREPSELQSLGKIPQSVNLPYKTHPNALSYSENVWKDTFPGVEKPALENELIFTCAAGVRAKFAADIAAENGYQNLGVYSGSFGDWQANGGKIEQI